MNTGVTMPGRTALLAIVIMLCLFSIFKNISYPLFWADEGMTVVGGERVLRYGYPKVHDGKNVLYDLRHPDVTLGLDEKTDAYVANANWGMYYVAAVGVKIAERFDDLYTKTGIIRSLFAALGVMGILIFGLNLARFFGEKRERLLVLTGYGLLVLLSVPLTLHIREARYYSLLLVSSAGAIYLFAANHILREMPYRTYAVLITLDLVLLFFSFPPAFFMFYIDAAVYLGAGHLRRFMAQRRSGMAISENLRGIWRDILKSSLPYLVGLALILPLTRYFRMFEIAEEMALFNGYGPDMYRANLATVWNYLARYDLVYLALVLKIPVVVLTPRLLREPATSRQFRMSSFLGIFLLVYVLFVARIPNEIFIRYFINLQPVLWCMALLDGAILLSVVRPISPGSRAFVRGSLLLAVALLAGRSIHNNREFIAGHCYELTHRYRGCLDYVVEYLGKSVKRPEELVIATNYEETSFMYYLDSKVTIGFVKNNLEDDLRYRPDIIIYRRGWTWLRDGEIFRNQLRSGEYVPLTFPVVDYAVNNIPETNENGEALRHQFKTLSPRVPEDRLVIFVRREKAGMFPPPRYDREGELL